MTVAEGIRYLKETYALSLPEEAIRKALDDVSFALPEGAFLSIFGPNGAGKTTLLRVLATLARPTS
ncbi:MAG: ATP-binding cassette domain-containing protein, partial [Clostridia bacterium]|nr:ATP-binding cassette domain-containing protein [Clostridia bacterium]